MAKLILKNLIISFLLILFVVAVLGMDINLWVSISQGIYEHII